MSTNTPTKLRQQRVWQATYRGIALKIINWSYGIPEETTQNWNFYVYLPEAKCANFDAIWLPDLVKQFVTGRKYVSHDYYVDPLNSVEIHGGITFYQKHGHTDGFRLVELGCDYAHLWDREREYDEVDLLRDAEKCIDSCHEAGILSVEAKP